MNDKIAIKIKGGPEMDIDPHRVIVADAILPDGFNPHNVRPFIVFSDMGPVTMVWADCVQDALDSAADNGMLLRFEIDEDADADCLEAGASLGNDGAKYDLTYCSVEEAEGLERQPIKTAILVAYAVGAGQVFLEE